MCPGYWSFYRVLPSFSWPIPSSISSGTWVLGRLLGFTEFLIEVGRFFPLPFRNGSDSVSSAQRLPRSFVCFFFFCFTEFLIEAGWLLIRIKEQFYGRDSSFIESWLELDRFHRWFRLELDLGSFTGFYRVFFYIDVTGFYRVFFPLNENSFSVGTRVSWNFDWNLIDFIVDFVLNLILGGLLGFTEFFFILVLLGFTEFLIEAGGFSLWNERAVLRSGLAFHRILNWQSNCNRLLGFTEFLFGCYWVLPSFLSSSALDCDFGKNGHAKSNSMTDLNL